jgi:hypothetical protein
LLQIANKLGLSKKKNPSRVNAVTALNLINSTSQEKKALERTDRISFHGILYI